MILLFIENLFISLSSVFANKTRSILTALGIIIGVVSVTMMGTLISGLDKTFENSMSWLGKDILYVSRYEWFGDMEWWEVRNRPRIRPEYVDKIKVRSKYALAVAPVMQRGASLSYGEKETRTEIFGTNEDYMETITTNIVQGRFFRAKLRRVMVQRLQFMLPLPDPISQTAVIEHQGFHTPASRATQSTGNVIGCQPILQFGILIS